MHRWTCRARGARLTAKGSHGLGLPPKAGWSVSCYVLPKRPLREPRDMKFNPYAALLTTGVLMLATVVFAQTRSSVALLKAGAASLDRDVSSFAARTLSSRDSSRRQALGPDERRMSGTRVALTDRKESVSEE